MVPWRLDALGGTLTEGGEAFLVNCGQTTDATRWHKLILGLKAGWAKKKSRNKKFYQITYLQKSVNVKSTVWDDEFAKINHGLFCVTPGFSFYSNALVIMRDFKDNEQMHLYYNTMHVLFNMFNRYVKYKHIVHFENM